MENNKWYLLGRWVEPVLANSPWVEFRSEELELDFFGDVEVLAYDYLVSEADMEKSADFVKQKIDGDKNWFDKFFSLCDKRVKNILYYKEHKDLSGFMRSLSELLNHDMLVFFLDYGLLKMIEKLQEKTDIMAGDVLAQIKPYKKTPLMEYHEELRNIDKKDIGKFVREHKWVGTHLFLGEPLNEEKVKKELADLSKKQHGQIEKELPNEYKDILEIGSKLAFYRSYMVETADKLMYEYWSDIKKLGEKYGLSWDEILLLTYKEVINLNDDGILPENFKERAGGYGVVFENNKMFVVVGNELKKRIEMYRGKVDEGTGEIKGMVACKGATVRGVVRIVEESKYISKINKGDILVASETTPDYVVGMRIAGAIITDMGGITSHAAITSREMKIPCIIGTKIATRVLKDGDLVEVDTDKGIVKIIKK